MTTYDLRIDTISMDELFRLAMNDTIRVITKDGHTVVIEAADEFEQEVAQLRNSQSFMDFLAQRSREKEGSISLDELERDIEAAVAREATETKDTNQNR